MMRQTCFVLILVLCLLSVAGVVECFAVASVVSTEPKIPLINVPFLVTPDSSVVEDGDSLYLTNPPAQSTSNWCNTQYTVEGASCTLGAASSANPTPTSCRLMVKASSLGADSFGFLEGGVPTLYWCSSAKGTETYLSVAQIETVSTTPGYVFLSDTRTTLTFNEATPVGTTVGFFRNKNCETRIANSDIVVLTDSREAVLPQLTTGNIAYICASVKYTLNNVESGTVPPTQGSLMIFSAVYASPRYELGSPTEGLRFTTVVVETNTALQLISLSKDRFCTELVQTPTAPDPTSGALIFPLTAERGEYFFCGVTVNTAGGGIFVAAENKFTILSYGMEPTAMYTNLRTTMKFTEDAVDDKSTVFESSLFVDKECKKMAPNFGWTTSLNWPVVTTAGTFYACVRQQKYPDTTTALANPIMVYELPALRVVDPVTDSVVFGLGMTMEVSRNEDTGVLTVGVAENLKENGECDLIASGVTSGAQRAITGSVKFVVPFRSTSSQSTLHTCLSTPGYASHPSEGYLYPISSVTGRPYHLTHTPFFVGRPAAIGLDTKVTMVDGSEVFVVPEGEGCETEDPSNRFPVSSPVTISPVQFERPETHLLCVKQGNYVDFGFGILRELDVHPEAVERRPFAVVAGLSTAVSIQTVPPKANVFFVKGDVCTGSVVKLFATQADDQGVAVPLVLHKTVETLGLCVEYEQESAGTVSTVAVYRGPLPVGKPVMYPSIALLDRVNQIIVQVEDPLALKDRNVQLVPGKDISCADTFPASSIQLPLTQGHDNSVGPYFSFTPTTSGVVYSVCVGAEKEYVYAGNLEATTPPTLTFSSELAVHELPEYVTFGGVVVELMQADAFVAVKEGTMCGDLSDEKTEIYASGTIDAVTGRSSIFLVPSGVASIQFCIAKKSNLLNGKIGYVYAGTQAVYPYTALSRYAQSGAFNTLTSWPLVSDGIVFLTPCASYKCDLSAATGACKSGERYFTSDILMLTGAASGLYYLCQESSLITGAVTGANNTVTVFASSSWSMTTAEDPIRQFRPFTVTVTGLTIPQDESPMVSVQPGDSVCGQVEVTPKESFALSTSGTASVTLTAFEPIAELVFCLELSSYDYAEGMRKAVYPYPSPDFIIEGKDTEITSSGSRASNVATKLSSTAQCSDQLSTGVSQLQNYKSTLNLRECSSTLTRVYYCESSNGATFANRGVLKVLRLAACPNGPTASIVPTEVLPGVPITSTGIDETILEKPFLSHNAACTEDLPSSILTTGYFPRHNEAALFYVCASPIGYPSVLFTTTSPTLTVKNWAVTPTSVLSRYSVLVGAATSTTMKINYQTSSTETFFSSAEDCEVIIGQASGFASSKKTASYSTTGVRGLTFVCTVDTVSHENTPVAAFLSVTPPTVLDPSPAIIIGASFTAFVIEGGEGDTPLYSMIPGADASYPYASYYTSESRDVFLSTRSNCAQVLPGTSATQVSSKTNDISIRTDEVSLDGVSEVYLCTGTPAGTGLAAVIPVASGSMYPTTFFTGVASPIYMPLNPNTEFHLSNGATDCSSLADIRSFTSNSTGYGSIDLRSPNGQPAPLGTYTLCYAAVGGSEQLTALGTIQVIALHRYSIAGLNYVVGIPGTMYLLEDLKTDYLLPGFSSDAACSPSDISSQYGVWQAISSSLIEVTAALPTYPLYLCATVPTNKTVVGLPVYPSFLSFIPYEDSIQRPSRVDTCQATVLPQCAAPGPNPPPNSGIISIIHGDCCNPLDRMHVVASTSANSTGGSCEIKADESAVKNYPEDTLFTMCAWDSKDPLYCTTLATDVPISTACSSGKDDSNQLSIGWIIAIVLLSLLLLVLIIALIIYVCCCCVCGAKEESEKAQEKRLVALRQMEGGSTEAFDALDNYTSESSGEPNGYGYNPLLYYAAVSGPSPHAASVTYSDRVVGGQEKALPLFNQNETAASWCNASTMTDEAACVPAAAGEEEEPTVVLTKEEIDAETSEEGSYTEEDEESAAEQEEAAIPEAVEQAHQHTVAMVLRIEDDTRDQLALDEARERFVMFQVWKETLERQRLKEKEEEVELGYEEDAPRVVLPPKNARTHLPLEEAAGEDETELESDLATEDLAHRLVRDEEDDAARPIPAPPLSQRGQRGRRRSSSYLGPQPGESEAAREERLAAVQRSFSHPQNANVEVLPSQNDVSRSEKSTSQSLLAAPPFYRDEVLPVNALHPYGQTKQSSSPEKAGSFTPDRSSQRLYPIPPPLAADVHEVSRGAPSNALRTYADEEEVNYKVSPAPAPPMDDRDGSSSSLRMGVVPIWSTSPEAPTRGHSGHPANDLSRSPSLLRRDLVHCMNDSANEPNQKSPSQTPKAAPGDYPLLNFDALPRGPSAEYMAEEEDYNAMSYTTTQRFHDETSFLFEEESSRRQRLSNWEEEERAHLAQLELDMYMKVSRQPFGEDIDDEDTETGELPLPLKRAHNKTLPGK